MISDKNKFSPSIFLFVLPSLFIFDVVDPERVSRDFGGRHVIRKKYQLIISRLNQERLPLFPLFGGGWWLRRVIRHAPLASDGCGIWDDCPYVIWCVFALELDARLGFIMKFELNFEECLKDSPRFRSR